MSRTQSASWYENWLIKTNDEKRDCKGLFWIHLRRDLETRFQSPLFCWHTMARRLEEISIEEKLVKDTRMAIITWILPEYYELYLVYTASNWSHFKFQNSGKSWRWGRFPSQYACCNPGHLEVNQLYWGKENEVRSSRLFGPIKNSQKTILRINFKY